MLNDRGKIRGLLDFRGKKCLRQGARGGRLETVTLRKISWGGNTAGSPKKSNTMVCKSNVARGSKGAPWGKHGGNHISTHWQQ